MDEAYASLYVLNHIRIPSEGEAMDTDSFKHYGFYDHLSTTTQLKQNESRSQKGLIKIIYCKPIRAFRPHILILFQGPLVIVILNIC
jgi:hypothetical protein